MRRFGRDEDGSMVIFALFLFIMMLIVGGMSVDLMRFETNRARLQATLDRAVLAAADLDQLQDPESVVEDYFDKADLLDQVTSITVTESINSREVTATAAMDIDMMFMNLVGVETLEAPAVGTAFENISDIEIVLVLDVSGSMNSSSRLINLRSAAREFVRTVLGNDDEDRISIAIVPFNAQVNLGPVLRGMYNVTYLHGVPDSNCVDLPPSVYGAPGLSTSLQMPQAGYFDAVSSTTQNTSYVAPQGVSTGNVFCRLEQHNIVRLPNNDIATLEAQIQALTGGGNTSITMGMKWGMALIDPGSRPMFSALIAGNHIPGHLAGRPYDYTRDNTLKVIVVMTDGEHVSSHILDESNLYRTGLSTIWRATGTDLRYSNFHASRVNATSPTTICNSRPFYVPHVNQWHSRPWNGTSPNTSLCYDPAAVPSGAIQQNWEQVWQNLRVRWVAWQLYARALGTNSTSRTNTFDTWMANFTSQTNVGNMNTTLQQSCALARANGVVVYGIAFEAPAGGQAQIAGCATSPSHYYNAQGLEISSAFRAIANQINALRLIQ